MTPVPSRFLVRVAYRCPYVADMPGDDEDGLVDLPPEAVLDPFTAMDGKKMFADVRLAWNAAGIGLSAEVRGKELPPVGDPDRPRQSDGLTLWVDTRDARSGHRATRYCHQFHFLPSGGGADHDEPLFVQTKIHRALADAPLAGAADVPFRVETVPGGYRIEAFLPAAVLTGFDPEQHPRLGVFYALRDQEHGEQTLGVGGEFPFWEDPSLWSVLELVR